MNPFVSVIVPVYNDDKRLKICLAALENQTYPKTLYEIIIVDNASDNARDIQNVVAECVREALPEAYRASIVCEPIPGSYAARNQGISLAKGEIIAFTDADCIPYADWIERGVKNLLQVPNCGLLVGKIEIFFKIENRATPVELYETIAAFPQKEFIEEYKGGATANLFTYRNVIERVGLFKTTIKSGGDIEWGQRVYGFGYKQIYADEVCVKHPARHSLQEIHKQTIRIAGGVYDRYLEDKKTFKEINLTFLRLVLNDFLLTGKRVLKIFKSERLGGVKQKIATSYVALFVGFSSSLEKLKLRFGKTSSRA
jgi:glycosyltransferase involved in cell wall biosynthesis